MSPPDTATPPRHTAGQNQGWIVGVLAPIVGVLESMLELVLEFGGGVGDSVGVCCWKGSIALEFGADFA